MEESKISDFLKNTEAKILKKNSNFEAKIIFDLIDETLDAKIDSVDKQRMISEYIVQLDRIYIESIEEKIDGDNVIKTSTLTTDKIQKYSVLKYFFRTKNDFMIDFMTDAILKDYNNELKDSFEVQEITIINVLTKENLILTKKTKKLLLKLLSNLIKAEQSTYDYSLTMEQVDDDTECIIANPEITKVKNK